MIEVSVPAADIAIATTNPVAAEIAEKSFGVAAIAEKLVVVVAAAAGIEATAVVLAAGIEENLDDEEEKSDIAGIEAKVVHDISEIEEKAVFVAGIAANLNQAAKSVVPGKAAKSAGNAAKPAAAAATISETAAAAVAPHRRVWRANAAAPRAVAAIRVPRRCCPRRPPARRRL